MTSIVYLTLEQVLVIHQDQIDRYGGSHGIRELALLESAIYRPQTTFGGEQLYPTIFDKVAALMHSLILNPPFVNGNKRTAMVAGIAFLKLNGYLLKVGQDELVEAALNIALKHWDIKTVAKWLEENTKSVS